MIDIAAALPRQRLWAELIGLFIGVPLVMAFLLPPTMMFTMLSAATFVGIVLLARTPGFDWRELLAGRFDWRFFGVFTGATALVSLAVVLVRMPEDLFVLPRTQPGLWVAILLLYPLVSAVPQELVFRPLFFRRYGALMPAGAAIWVNAGLFAFAHLLYRDPLVLAMTFAGGLAFAWAYARKGSFALACATHAVAGCIVFTIGLGRLFYSGAVNP